MADPVVWTITNTVVGLVRAVLAFFGLKGPQSTAPMVRVVAMFPQQMFIAGPRTGPMPRTSTILLDYVKLKNEGGTAFAVKMFDPSRSALMLEVDVVEPLGTGPDEAHRLGAVERKMLMPMQMSREYALYYQDTLGKWHRTVFTPRPQKIDCTFTGPVKNSDVPPEVRSLGTVARR